MAEPPPKVECPICYNEIEIGEDYAECPSHHVANVDCARRASESEMTKLIEKLRIAQGRLQDITEGFRKKMGADQREIQKGERRTPKKHR